MSELAWIGETSISTAAASVGGQGVPSRGLFRMCVYHSTMTSMDLRGEVGAAAVGLWAIGVLGKGGDALGVGRV